MIGSLLKELMSAVGNLVDYRLRKIFHLPHRSAAANETAAAPGTPTIQGKPVYTATDTSIAALSDVTGLASDYTTPIGWACHRIDVPPDEVVANPLYARWSRIPGGHKWTQYFSAYEAVFGPLRTVPLRILEIGIWQGASIKLWKEYFEHPKTMIVGVDVLPECRRFDAPEAGVHVRIGSQADPVFLKQVVDEFGPFDLVIDDGSHHSSHIIASFNHLFDLGLKDTGIYFVEDLHANYWHPWRDSRMSFLDVCKELLEHMHAHYRGASPVDFLIDTPSARPTLEIEVPRITTMIKEIRFFDSMVAIYKSRLGYVPYYLRPNDNAT